MAVLSLCIIIAVIASAVNCHKNSSTLKIANLPEYSSKGNATFQDKSLRDVILMAENMLNGKLGDFQNFMNGTKQQVLLMRQILVQDNALHVSGNSSKVIADFEAAFKTPRKLLLHQHLIDEMILFLDTLFITKRSIVVFTDKSEHGETALARISQRCHETNRTISAFKIVSLKTTREAIQEYMKSDVFVLDCDGKMARRLLYFAKEMGYTGYRDAVNWVLSHRTMTSLPLSRSLPVTRLFGIQPVFGDGKDAVLPSENCQSSNSYKEMVHCRRKSYNIKDVIVQQLWAKPTEENENVWVITKSSEETNNSDQSSQSIYPTISHLNPLWPVFNVAVPDTFRPWVTIVNYSKAIPDFPLCGISGKYGHRYVNSTTNVTEPICVYGLAIDIIRHLEETLEINCNVYVPRDGLYGSYNETTGKATGVVAEIASGAADFVVDMLDEPSRRKILEFTTPYVATFHGIAYVHNNLKMRSGVFSPFSGMLWLVIIAVVLGLVVFLWGFEKTSRIHQNSEESPAALSIVDSMEYIWGTACCGEIILSKPFGVAGRLLSVFASFFFIVAVGYYSAELITSFVVTDEIPSITGLKDILDDGHNVGVHRATGTANYLQNNQNSKVRQLFAKMQIFNSYEESINALKTGKIKYFVADYLSLTTTAKFDKNCTFHVVKADKGVAFIGIAFKPGSPLKRKLNMAAASLTFSGKKDGMLRFWFGSGKCKVSNDFYSLQPSHFKNSFIGMAYGLLVSLCVLVISLSWKCIRKYRETEVSQNIEGP